MEATLGAIVFGDEAHGEHITVSAYPEDRENAKAGQNVVYLKAQGSFGGDVASVDLTLASAKQLAQHLLDAVEFLENS